MRLRIKVHFDRCRIRFYGRARAVSDFVSEIVSASGSVAPVQFPFVDAFARFFVAGVDFRPDVPCRAEGSGAFSRHSFEMFRKPCRP